MTNEKAIELLHRLQDEQFDGIHGDERREALEMAVRALFSQQIVNDSQGLVNDCISRKMAIDAFEPTHYKDWYTPTIIETLEALPSAQPTQTNAHSTQINTLDCVSRQAAIEEVINLWADKPFGNPTLVEIKDCIEALPSAQPTQTNAHSTQINTLDCVSRQAAIDAVSEGCQELRGVFWECKEKLLALPSVQPHWIPCSVRLPEDNVPVNITWINRKPEFYYAEIKDVPFTATGVYFKGKWYWYSSTVEDYLAEYGRAEWDEIEEAMHNSIEVVAWMPLPEPYGGGDAK